MMALDRLVYDEDFVASFELARAEVRELEEMGLDF